MSEYQYYEFQAVDRPLNDKEMNELRSFSTRAEITPHSFINDYSWGSFKGDEDRWIEKYFDGFLYYANWGTHILKLRLPSILLDLQTTQNYCNGDHFSVRLSGDKVILDFLSENEDGGDWEEDLRLTSFLSLRTDLSRGDLRCLYLGWLSGLQSDEYDEEEIEPPVPPGLQNLSPTLANLADFLRIDPDLIDAAAINSPSLEDITPSATDLRTWIATLSINERDDLLANILAGSIQGDQTAALQQVRRFTKIWQTLRGDKKAKIKPRTVKELLKKADLVRQNRERLQAEKKAAELAEKQRVQKIAREKRLNEITCQESILWAQIESLVSEKKAKSYDKAIELLTDLRDLAARTKASDFHIKLKNLREKHSPKSSFIERLRIFS
jgi:hypothetical protein